MAHSPSVLIKYEKFARFSSIAHCTITAAIRNNPVCRQNLSCCSRNSCGGVEHDDARKQDAINPALTVFADSLAKQETAT
jgi:hypothetical protein